jgi:FKBP-type peptidyl-prolyl cis-trans isomerase SlyD
MSQAEFFARNTHSAMTVEDNTVVTMKYMLTVDGEVVDQSDEGDPIQFLQGNGEIIPGLERGIYGMSPGESKKILVSAADGYGEMDEEAYATIPRSEFPEDFPLEVGVELQIRDQDGDVYEAHVEEILENAIVLDMNHTLAGKDLHFDVTIIDIRLASEEEIEHGHVHIEGEFADQESPFDEGEE